MALKTFKTIKIGDKGSEVKKICAALKKNGSTIKPTDEYTIGMLSAVRAFQKKQGLPVTGVVDKKTWDKLMMPIPVFRKPKKHVAKKAK